MAAVERKYRIHFFTGILFLTLGCTPQGRYKILNLFFDGVPAPVTVTAADSMKTRDSVNSSNVYVLAMEPVIYSHKPYNENECEKCHLKGGGGLTKTVPELCYSCHAGFASAFAIMHGPASSGYCLTCHDQHSSPNKKLLLRKGQDLCLECHDKALVSRNTKHKDIGEESCTVCHNPHGGENRFILRPGSCYNCHEDFSKRYASMHGPAASGNCTACHEDHESRSKKLLVRTGQELCLYCHDPGRVKKNKEHKAIGKTGCIKCHNPHGWGVRKKDTAEVLAAKPALPSNAVFISGKLLSGSNREDAVQNAKMVLYSNKDSLLQSGSAGADGSFIFSGLAAGRAYKIVLPAGDSASSGYENIYLADAQNRIVRAAEQNIDGGFIFENLPVNLSKLPLLKARGLSSPSFSIAGGFYMGEGFSPLRLHVKQVNGIDSVLQTSVSDAFGQFAMTGISPDEDLLLSTAELAKLPAGSGISFTNIKGKEVSGKKESAYAFRAHTSDSAGIALLKVSEDLLLMDLTGFLLTDKPARSPVAYAQIVLSNDSGKTISKAMTDASGSFTFSRLSVSRPYKIGPKEGDRACLSKNVYVADARGNILSMVRSATGKTRPYAFTPSELPASGRTYLNDPWFRLINLQSEPVRDSLIIITENIYFKPKKWDLLPEGKVMLNKAVTILRKNPGMTLNILSHTDSRGEFEFNQDLSKKRANAAIDHMVSKGINRNLLTGFGVGEWKILNKCKDGVECTEEEHALNSRMEFQFRLPWNEKRKGNK